MGARPLSRRAGPGEIGAKGAIALAAALLVAGSAFALPSLLVPGVALAVLAGGAVGWALLATHGARIERLPGPPTVTESEPYPLSIRLRGGLLPPRGELVDPLLGSPRSISLAGLRGAGIARTRLRLREDVRFERRGRHSLEPPRLVVRDPLGLCTRRVEGRAGGEVLVLPRIEPVLVSGARDGDGDGSISGAGEGDGAGLAATLDVELDGLRPYRRGSPASRIHWPALARHGELIERRFASGSDGTAFVVLDAERPADPDALDRAVRAAASLCVHLAEAGGCTLLISGSPRPLRIDAQLRGWPQAHARLALVEPGGGLAGVARAATDGAAFWVTAAAEDAAPRGLARLRGRASFLVTPFAPAGGGAAFTVAGCHGRRLAARRRPMAGRAAA